MRRYYKFIPIILIVLHACGTCDCITPPDNPDGYRYFMISASADSFVVRTSDSGVLQIADSLLALPLEERNMLIIGPIERGNEEYNLNWSWHLKTNEWTFAEVAIELCDGTPAYVEENLDNWLETVGSYCPWGSRLERELSLIK